MLTVRNLMQQLAQAREDTAIVRVHDDQGRVWDILAAVQLQNRTVALQARQRVPGPDTLAKIDEALVRHLTRDLDELNEAYRTLKLERDHWRHLLRRSENKLSMVKKILEGT